jgi:long-chain acyl-CoA synthetase
MSQQDSAENRNPKSLPALLVKNARRFGDRRVAMREKEFGIWQSVTWRQYLEGSLLPGGNTWNMCEIFPWV